MPKGSMPVWTEKMVKVADLTPYERNPRRISKKAFQDLLDSVRRNGYHQRIIATPDLRVIGGHQRIKVLKELGIKEIQILVPDRPLTEEEFKRILIQDNLPFGEFDYDILSADYEPAELVSYGMPPEWLNFLPEGEESAPEAAPQKEVECPNCQHKFKV